MTATGALIARHVTDLVPTQTSRFDLAQAARRGVIAPLRSVRIPPGVGVRSIANVPLRRGEVDQADDVERPDDPPFARAHAHDFAGRRGGGDGAHFSPRARSIWNCSTENTTMMRNSTTATVAP